MCHLLSGSCQAGPLSCSLVLASYTAPFTQSPSSVLRKDGSHTVARPLSLCSYSPMGDAGLRDGAVPGAPRSRSRHPLPPDPIIACFHRNRAVTQDFGTS